MSVVPLFARHLGTFDARRTERYLTVLRQQADIFELNRVTDIYESFVWLNPVAKDHWKWTPSIQMVNEQIGNRMFPLTLDGLDSAMRELMR